MGLCAKNKTHAQKKNQRQLVADYRKIDKIRISTEKIQLLNYNNTFLSLIFASVMDKKILKLIVATCGLIFSTGCIAQPICKLTVTNDMPEARTEIAEVSLSELNLPKGKPFRIIGTDKEQIPYQITYDGKLIFTVNNIPANGTETFTIVKGKAMVMDSLVRGRRYPERKDDMAWENDKAAYRAYGPALQVSGERSFGYDIINKSTDKLVMDARYAKDLDPVARKQIADWRAQGLKAKADSLAQAISYHVDHGDGMDCYSVGATLGGGTTALMVGDSIVYPYCWAKGEVLDNGPLRFTTRLTYNPTTIGNSSDVVETRLISLDAGSNLNRTVITYANLKKPTAIVTGIVMHKENRQGYYTDDATGCIAYADSTDNPCNNNGVIYVGAVFEKKPDMTYTQWFSPADMAIHSGAIGHVLAQSTYKPGEKYVYYWGSGWSKNNVNDYTSWKTYLKDFIERSKSPLRVTVTCK